jgi:site-specific recombinase XerD
VTSRSVAVDRFLAVSRARLAPSTVDSYRRDLEHVGTWLGRDIAAAGQEDIERYLAELRAAGRANSTVARRLAALRAFFRPEQLVGGRPDNPAAEIPSPRRIRRLPRPLSPAEAERAFIDTEQVTRVGEPEDIANLIVFVVSPKGRFLHGALIDMDGGATKTI